MHPLQYRQVLWNDRGHPVRHVCLLLGWDLLRDIRGEQRCHLHTLPDGDILWNHGRQCGQRLHPV